MTNQDILISILQMVGPTILAAIAFFVKSYFRQMSSDVSSVARDVGSLAKTVASIQKEVKANSTAVVIASNELKNIWKFIGSEHFRPLDEDHDPQ